MRFSLCEEERFFFSKVFKNFNFRPKNNPKKVLFTTNIFRFDFIDQNDHLKSGTTKSVKIAKNRPGGSFFGGLSQHEQFLG